MFTTNKHYNVYPAETHIDQKLLTHINPEIWMTYYHPENTLNVPLPYYPPQENNFAWFSLSKGNLIFSKPILNLAKSK